MEYYIIIPAYNEAEVIHKTLDSIVTQTMLPKRVIVVDDNSTDYTSEVVNGYCENYLFIDLVNKSSEAQHQPGSKVIQAFNEGLKLLDDDYDFISKLDADLILPPNYFEIIAQTFSENEKVGMVGGFAYIEVDGKWQLEQLTDKDHIRGALKSYRKDCFTQIGGLREAMGWDTADELLARYFRWEIKTIPELKVKHLRPTGAKYTKEARYKQGEAFYRLGYGLQLTTIAALKLALRKKQPLLAADYIKGFQKAKQEGIPLLVDDEQAVFIRNYRWKNIRKKLFRK